MADTYTNQLGAQEQKIESLTKAVSSGISGLPGVTSALRKSLYEREKTLPALERENEGKIQELYTADKRLAERYSNPESEMYIENPYERQGLISGQKADIRGELGNILNLIQQRSQTIGNAIDKGMELYKYGLQAQQLELSQAEKQWSRIWQKYQEDERKKSSGKDYSGYQMLLEALGGDMALGEKPAYSPVDKNKTVNGWKYDVKTGDWVPANEKAATYQKLLEASKTNPQVAALAFSSGIFPFEEEDSEYAQEDAIINSLQASGGDLNSLNLGQSSYDSVIARMYQRGLNFDTVTGQISGGGGNAGTPTMPTTTTTPGGGGWLQNIFNKAQSGFELQPTAGVAGTIPANQSLPFNQSDVNNAQALINSQPDPVQRADIYDQIVTDYPGMKPYLHP